MTLTEHAERLVTDWAAGHRSLTGAYELALVDHVLTQLADPRSEYGPLLDEICQRRWFAGQAARL